jgi:hypothetical protein
MFSKFSLYPPSLEGEGEEKKKKTGLREGETGK